MKITKPIVLAIATVAVITGTGVAAAYSDIQLIPAGPRIIRETPKAPIAEPEQPAPENAETDNLTGPENQVSNSEPVASPEANDQTNTPNETEASNEPTPAVEEDPTPEPLPAPDTNITHVENTNNVLGNNTAGNVSHN